MIGNAPVPVPMTSRRHFQGISSSMDSGVCPKASRNFLDGFFLRLPNLAAIDHHVVFVGGAIDADRTKRVRFEADAAPPVGIIPMAWGNGGELG